MTSGGTARTSSGSPSTPHAPGVRYTWITSSIAEDGGTLTMRFTIWHSSGDPQDYIDTAVAAEAAGFHSTAIHEGLFYPEHVSRPYPYTEDGKRGWEPTA